MRNSTKAYILSLIAVFFWSTVATAFKLTLRYVTPYEMLFYAVITTVIITGFIIFFKKRKIEWNKKAIFLGILNPFLYYILLFEAYNRLLAQQALCINYLWPLVLVLISVLFGKEKLILRSITGILLGFLGVVLVATKGDYRALAVSDLKGVIFALLSTVVWAVYWHINRKIKVNAEDKLFQGFLFALPFLLFVLFIQGIRWPGTRGLIGSLYIGTFEMGITFLVWLSSLQIAKNVHSIASLIYLAPPLSLLIIAVVLKEKIYPATLLGLLFVLTGVWLARSE